MLLLGTGCSLLGPCRVPAPPEQRHRRGPAGG